MERFVEEPLRSITTEGSQRLVLPAADARLARGRRICILDDVVSTGETLEALSRLAARAGGRVTSKCAIWKEGPWYASHDLIYIGTLPVFMERTRRQEPKPGPSRPASGPFPSM